MGLILDEPTSDVLRWYLHTTSKHEQKLNGHGKTNQLPTKNHVKLEDSSINMT